LFWISRPAGTTLVSVSERSQKTPKVASTLPLVLLPLGAIASATEIRRLVLGRFPQSRPEAIATTRPTAFLLSRQTLATAIPPSVQMRFCEMIGAITTSLWVSELVKILLRAITISTSAIKVLLARVAPFELVVSTKRGLLLPASLARQ